MLNNLESTLQRIISESASSMARQIAHAIRQSLAAELLGSPSHSAAASAPAASAPAANAPKRRGRPPGSKSKAAAVAAPAAPAASVAAPAASVAAPAAATNGRRKRRSFKRRIIIQSELDAVLNVLSKKPGQTSVQIQQSAGIDAKQAARVLGKLRETSKVKWKGNRSGAVYTAA